MQRPPRSACFGWIQAMFFKYLLSPLLFVDKNVGGQAVIEGVMMRSPDRVSTSVRHTTGEIITRSEQFRSLTQKKRLLGRPIIRGVISFFEMLILGIKTLNYSAEIAAAPEDSRNAIGGPVSAKIGVALGLALIIALGFGIALFFFLPLFLTQLLGFDRQAFLFNLTAGLFRVAFFLAYIAIISTFKDIKRIFEYHGAEHKAIHAFENDLPLTVENAARFATLHPRCGTSFILIVAFLAVFMFSLSDSLFAVFVGRQPGLLQRFGIHLLLLPLIAGFSYELLKLSGKTRDRRITRMLIAPGLWLQKITTREPDASQLQVAIAALKSSVE